MLLVYKILKLLTTKLLTRKANARTSRTFVTQLTRSDLEIWKLLEISMDVIGQHLDMLDAHWLTFGNLGYIRMGRNLVCQGAKRVQSKEEDSLRKDDTQIREAFQFFSVLP